MNIPLPGGIPPLAPWEGQTQITAHLVLITTSGEIDMGATTSEEFTINHTSIDITNPLDSNTAPTVWEWGTPNKTIGFNTTGDIHGVKIELKRASDSNFSLTLAESCQLLMSI